MQIKLKGKYKDKFFRSIGLGEVQVQRVTIQNGPVITHGETEAHAEKLQNQRLHALTPQELRRRGYL